MFKSLLYSDNLLPNVVSTVYEKTRGIVVHLGSVQRALISNRLLAALPVVECERFLPKLHEVALTFNSIIYTRGDIIRDVYFPISGVVSLMTMVDDRSAVDVGMVGSEGMIGLSLFMGVTTSLGGAIVEGSGAALRLKAADFLDECRNGGALPRVMLRYARSMLAQIAQSAACYRFHRTEMRLARRLLMMSDRMQTLKLQMTQDFLSKTLGVRREAVTLAAGSLQTSKLISNSRGSIVILDRTRLEAAACKCYRVIRDEETSFPSAE